jgi:anti-sigma factor (TIGR02949 family)
MTCEELITYLSEYIDGDLSEDLRADAQEHLATCNNCHVVLDTTQQMIVLLRQSGPQSIPIDRRQALFQKLNGVFEQRRAKKLASHI